MMYQAHPPQFSNSVKAFFGRKTILSRLILINLLVFLLGYFVHLGMWLFKLETTDGMRLFTEWLAVPSSTSRLLQKPWTPLTYMFLHESFFHLLFNMVTLYFGSTIFLKYFNDRQLLLTYLIGGLLGALFYILAFNFFPVFLEANPYALALGASASALAVVIAAAMFAPQYTVNLMFIGQVRMKYIALFFILMDIFSIQGNNPGGHIAHLGGAVWGALYALSLRNGVNPFKSLRLFKGGRLRKRRKQNSASPSYGRPVDDDQYNRKRNERQQQVDLILDKISKHGYDSLSEQEKAILFSHSRK
ncbi:rhomboid family intramembrane serine protease [Bacteroidales bacterium]